MYVQRNYLIASRIPLGQGFRKMVCGFVGCRLAVLKTCPCSVTDQMKSNEMKSNQSKSNLIRLNDIKSNQIESNQIKPRQNFVSLPSLSLSLPSSSSCPSASSLLDSRSYRLHLRPCTFRYRVLALTPVLVRRRPRSRLCH